MAQLFFKYGTMNCGKSLHLQLTAHNYEEQGKKVIAIKPVIDNRSNDIYSRAGLTRAPDFFIFDNTNIYNEVKSIVNNKKVACILVDEAQFLKKEQVIQLGKIVDELNIPVMAYGLKNDFKNDLFEGSYHLLVNAEKLEEIKTICWYCESKAFMVVRFEDGKPVYEGRQIIIDNEENRRKNIQYRPVCRKCYNNAESLESQNNSPN